MSEQGIWVDLAFPIRGKSLPLDHGYALFAAASRVAPLLHQNPTWGLHPVFGTRLGPGVLGLRDRSYLKIRLPADSIGAVLPLGGQQLAVDGHAIVVGVPRIFPLLPAATLKARFVTIKKFKEEPAPFLDAARRQLAALEGLGQDPERLTVTVGERRVVHIAGKAIVGFSLGVEGLEAGASLCLQRCGLGGRRHMGAGLFVPPGRRG
jgi:CRISPR-associated protein Cas6